MAELKMTPRRLEMLRAVGEGRVVYWPPYDGEDMSSWAEMRFAGGPPRVVTARASAAVQAGWISIAAPDRPGYGMRRYELTDAGRAVLEAADE